MIGYLNILQDVIDNGNWVSTRTGEDCLTIPSTMFKHDMKNGFPLLTTKKINIYKVSAELEMFIKGVGNKKFLHDRDCHIWDNWANPKKVKYGTNLKTLQDMKKENDLGEIYGVQWRGFSDPNVENSTKVDQLKFIIDKIRSDPNNRRLLCSSWNPLALDHMALPPCHVLWKVDIIGNRLNLTWYQRSVDVPIGLPFNIAQYALLLKLLCQETGYKEGCLTGFLSNVHIYKNQLDKVKNVQLKRTPKKLPNLYIKNFKNIFEWKYKDIELVDYEHDSFISYPVSV